ncbi:MAG: hypothetical protein K2M07_00335 [Muribaculaceae bacterium]|nr:hypothetical protein [Muribaculaceae bacterium]
MKKILSSVITLLFAFAINAQSLDIFNHLSVGAGVGTNGVSIEVASPLTPWVQVRAGVSIMPDITFNTDTDVDYTRPDGSYASTEIDLKGGLGRTQGSLIFNAYPVPKIPVYVAVGAYFGGNNLLKLTGHSDDLRNLKDASIEVGDYNIPVDKDGNVRGGLRVNSFRPYFGIGWGRAVPKKRVNFSMDLGIQIEGTPKVYSESGDIEQLENFDYDNDYQKVINNLKIYPVLTFRISGRIF